MAKIDDKAFARGVDSIFRMFHLRWHLANQLCRLAIWIAPRGAARDLLIAYFAQMSEEVFRTIDGSWKGRSKH